MPSISLAFGLYEDFTEKTMYGSGCGCIDRGGRLNLSHCLSLTNPYRLRHVRQMRQTLFIKHLTLSHGCLSETG